MSLPSWPEAVPGLELEGFSETPDSGVARTQMDSGPANTRARYRAVSRALTNIILMSDSQYDSIRAFHDDTCSMGAAPFEFEDRAGQVREMRFLAPPSITSAVTGGLYQTRITVEVLP